MGQAETVAAEVKSSPGAESVPVMVCSTIAAVIGHGYMHRNIWTYRAKQAGNCPLQNAALNFEMLELLPMLGLVQGIVAEQGDLAAEAKVRPVYGLELAARTMHQDSWHLLSAMTHTGHGLAFVLHSISYS